MLHVVGIILFSGGIFQLIELIGFFECIIKTLLFVQIFSCGQNLFIKEDENECLNEKKSRKEKHLQNDSESGFLRAETY